MTRTMVRHGEMCRGEIYREKEREREIEREKERKRERGR